MREVLRKAREIADEISKQEEVLIITHIDADGITAGSIAYQALERAGIETDIRFIKQLDSSEVEAIKDLNRFVWFTDLGSGQLEMLEEIDFVVTDHHLPQKKHRMQLNPHEFGYDGTVELSGAATTYLVASNVGRKQSLFDFERRNFDLAPLAVVGAVGDLQDARNGKLVGLNRFIANEARKYGYLEMKKDLRFFGKQTRPISKMLEYTFEPYLPGISGNEEGAKEFLRSLGVTPKFKWIEISSEERRLIVSAIVELCMEYSLPFSSIIRIVGETYILLKEAEGTEKRDAMEFSTLLNATARYGETEVGLRVCFGDEKAFKRARSLLQNHRRNLSEGIRFVGDNGLVELRNLQYFHAEGNIPDTIVGIVAGMCFQMANRNKPIIAFADTDDGVKVSARATYRLVDKGIHLAKAIRLAAQKVGGEGGGHSVAAGATIPAGMEEEFIKILDDIIGMQLKGEKLS